MEGFPLIQYFSFVNSVCFKRYCRVSEKLEMHGKMTEKKPNPFSDILDAMGWFIPRRDSVWVQESSQILVVFLQTFCVWLKKVESPQELVFGLLRGSGDKPARDGTSRNTPSSPEATMG